jgi:hypothetical protein
MTDRKLKREEIVPPLKKRRGKGELGSFCTTGMILKKVTKMGYM